MDQKLFQERVSLFHDAYEGRSVSRVPTVSFIHTWAVFDSDTKAKLSEATSNWELMEKIVRESLQRYAFDAWVDLGVRNNGGLNKIFPNMRTHIDDERETIYILDNDNFRTEEFGEYSANYPMYAWTKLVPRLHGELTLGQLEDGIKANMAYSAYSEKITRVAAEEFSLPPLTNGAMVAHPMAGLCSIRGIKKLSVDLRRRPDVILETIEKGTAGTLRRLEAGLNNKLPWETAFDFMYGWTSPIILSEKQFGTFYFPLFKKIIDTAAQHNARVYFVPEGSLGRFVDYFRDFPVGSMIAHLEQDDIFEIRRNLPNLALAGGMPVTLLGAGTKEQCIDRAKALLEGLGNQGYVFSQDKMLSYRNDATRENMLATLEFVNSYRFD